MSKPTNNFANLNVTRQLNFNRTAMSSFKEGSGHGPAFSASATLAEGIVTHRHNLALVIKEKHVVKACRDLFNVCKILDQHRLIVDQQLTHYLRLSPYSEMTHLFSLWKMLNYFVKINLSFC